MIYLILLNILVLFFMDTIFNHNVSEAGGISFGNNTMAAMPLDESPTTSSAGHWSAYVMHTDNVPSTVISVRVSLCDSTLLFSRHTLYLKVLIG